LKRYFVPNIKHLFYIIFCDFNFCGPELTTEIRLPQKLPVIRYIKLYLYRYLCLGHYGWKTMAWLENYGWRPMSRTPMSGALCLDRYNKLVWRPMVSDTVCTDSGSAYKTTTNHETTWTKCSRPIIIDYIVTLVTYPAIYDNGCDHLVFRLPVGKAANPVPHRLVAKHVAR
jgi:hypothetical protein